MKRSTSPRNVPQTSDATADSQRTASYEVAPVEALPGPGAVAGLTDSRFDLPANTPVRGAVARSLQSTHGNAYVQRLMSGTAQDATPGSVPRGVSDGIESRRGSGSPLPEDVRNEMEPAFGQSLAEVRIHTDPMASRLATSLSAKAFTTGRDIFFADGAHSPTSSEGKKTLAHELTHVVQQQGASRPAGLTEPGSAAELAAEETADRVTTGRPIGKIEPEGVGPARSLADLTQRMAKGAYDAPGYADIEKLVKSGKAELELLHVDDLRALERSTSALIGSTAQESHAPGSPAPVPAWTDMARLFLKNTLQPVIAAKLRDGEVAKLFWPLIEYMKANVQKPRIQAAFLNVLPYTERYVSDATRNAPAEVELSVKEKLEMGAPGPAFEPLMTECATEERSPDLQEVAETFVNVPKKVASLIYEAVSAEEVEEGLADAREVDGEELRARGQARLTKLGKAIIAKLGNDDENWMRVYKDFGDRFDAGGAAAVLNEMADLINSLARDSTTVTSCYLTVELGGKSVPGYEQESPDERFERALETLTQERAGGADPTPLSWSNPEAQVAPGVWHEVEIIEQRGEDYWVHPVGMATEYDTVVGRDDLRPKSRWSKGEEVMIDWEGTLYPGRVLEIEGKWARVHWYGYDESWDEMWIAAERLQAQGGKGNPSD